MTLQNASPGLDDYERDKKFSKSFKQMIASCLVKDPSKRPSATKLLKHPFFKQARSSDYIVRTLLDSLPALGDRLEELEDMKTQASLVQDEDIVADKDQKGSIGSPQGGKFQYQFSFTSQYSDSTEFGDNNQPVVPISADLTCAKIVAKDVSIGNSMQDFRNSSNCCVQNPSGLKINSAEKVEPEVNGKSSEKSKLYGNGSDKFYIQIPSPSICNSDIVPKKVGDMPSENGSRASKALVNNYEPDENTKGPVVQQKGRFKVTSEKVGSLLQKSQGMQVISQHPAVVSSPVTPTNAVPPNIPNPSLYPMLQSLLQSNIIQREYMLSLMKQLAIWGQAVDGGGCMSTNTTASEKSLLKSAHDREKDLLREITDLQRRLVCAQEELQKHKTDHPPEDL